MAYGAAFHKSIDGRLGLTSGPSVPLGALLWKASTTWAAGAVVQNGNFIFSTVAGGAGATTGIGPTPGALTDNSCTWVLVGPCSPFAVSDAAAALELGYISLGKDFGPNSYGDAEFRYVKFTGSTDIVSGDWIVIDAQGQTGIQSPTSAPGANKLSILGVAVGSHKLSVATPTYGWVMVRGVFDGVAVNTTFTAGAICSGSGTAGSCIASTTPTSTYVFDGAVLRAGSATRLSTVELYWPMCSGR